VEPACAFIDEHSSTAFVDGHSSTAFVDGHSSTSIRRRTFVDEHSSMGIRDGIRDGIRRWAFVHEDPAPRSAFRVQRPEQP
jgi:hypothetical protein